MRNRTKQRENRRKYGTKRVVEKPWLNAEGYHDPTAFHGMHQAMKAQAPSAPEGRAVSILKT